MIKKCRHSKLLNGVLFFLGLTGFFTPVYASEFNEEPPLEIHVAISMNLSQEAIKSFAKESEHLKARLVLRGLPLTADEVKVLQGRGHFSEVKEVQEENRAILRRGFMRINEIAQAGLVLEIDPPFFRDFRIETVPTIVFKRGDEAISLSGIPSIRAAIEYAVGQINQNEAPAFHKALLALEGGLR